jgi:hypothetical protein
MPSSRVTAPTRAALRRTLAAIAFAGVAAGIPFSASSAQRVDTTRITPRPPAPVQLPAVRDSARPPISPKRAFLYSLLLPGYGQSVLDRPIAGALFFGAEVAWVALATKSAADLRFARAHRNDSLVVTYRFDDDGVVQRDSLGVPVVASVGPNRYAEERLAARRKHLEDYYALLIATHLLAGAEAFVAAQLWDLPARVSIKALPFGAALAATIRW